MEAVGRQDTAALLRERGLRVTAQRRVILEAFREDEGGHLTADEVHTRASEPLPELARATVYNTLAEFVRAGLLRPIEGRGATRYDANLDEGHHHFRCIRCDRLFDVHPVGVDALTVAEPGFRVERTQVLLEGVCSECDAVPA